MTISTEVRKAGPFIGNGSASAFPFAFKVFKAADLIVVRRQDNIGTETTLVLDSDYHVTLNSNQDTTPGGVVTLVAGALASGFTLVVSSELPYLQPTDLTNQGGFYPKVITNALDRLTIFCQQLAENLGRTLKLPITAPTNISTEIPLPNPSELIAWNETGTGLTTIRPQSLVTSIAYGSATADLFAGDGVTTTFPLTTNPASVNNLDVSVGGYSQRPVQGGIGDYSWNGGASITFEVPPPAPTIPGDKNILVRYMQAIPVSDSEALHAQTREALRRGYAEAGYTLVAGSFETGGTLTAATDVLLQESTGATYAWTGSFPKVVAPGFDPVGVVGFELRTDAALRAALESGGLSVTDIANFKESSGAGNIGIDMLSAYMIGTVGAELVPIPNGDNTGASDCTAAFNAAILAKFQKGGGILKPIPGTYRIDGSILLPSRIYLDLRGCTITGTGANTLIKSGGVTGGVLSDITTEYGTSAQGAGFGFVGSAGIIGGNLKSAALGIRGHRFNYGTTIYGTRFDGTLTQSWYTTHSWGLKIEQCTVYAPAVMSDFVDWTEVCGNSFEGQSSAITARALTIQGSYGGSYTANVHNNGFHHWSHGIEINCEASDMELHGNHFEDVVYHINGNSLTKRKFQIHSNWMKANLAIPAATVIPITFTNLRDSVIGPNDYTTDGSSSFSAKVVLSNANCWGNDVWIEYDPTNGSSPDLTKYQVNAANTLNFRNGSNNPSVVHPAILPLAGTSGYTIEQYKRVYHAVANNIPFCTTTYSGTTATIDTWIPSDTYGTAKMVAFNFRCAGTVTYVIAGFICMNAVTIVAKKDLFTGVDASGVVVTATNNGGIMRITIAGLASGGNITGWVKEM